MSKWKPIETMPRPRGCALVTPPFLTCIAGKKNSVRESHAHINGWVYLNGQHETGAAPIMPGATSPAQWSGSWKPTHWQPMPKEAPDA